VAHPRAKLTVFGRQLLVTRVLGQGWPAAHVAEQLGVSRATAYKWVRRYRAEGEAGLLDRSSRPHRSPRRLSEFAEAEILEARARVRYGPDRLGPMLGRPPSTIHRVLVRRGFNRLRDADRVTVAPIRYVACHPGALVHQDHKKLGRIPDGGGWRALGREIAPHHRRSNVGYEHLEVVIDDASRLAVVVPVPDESSQSAARALELAAVKLAARGFSIESRRRFDVGARRPSRGSGGTSARVSAAADAGHSQPFDSTPTTVGVSTEAVVISVEFVSMCADVSQGHLDRVSASRRPESIPIAPRPRGNRRSCRPSSS
jgi:transposase-like protein